KIRGNAPRSNKAQNEQTRAVAVKLNLSKNEARQLHDAIHDQGYSYQEILQIAKDMFK
ncbi:MAG: hypothetical protein GX905_09965, partial [Bacteroidales bacterium]|nr:hypothetical protein [Bacteroidales bacterium]